MEDFRAFWVLGAGSPPAVTAHDPCDPAVQSQLLWSQKRKGVRDWVLCFPGWASADHPQTHTSASHSGCSPWQPGQPVQHTASIISGLIGMGDGNFNKAPQLVLESLCRISCLDAYTPSRDRPSHFGEDGGRNLLQLRCGTKQTGKQTTKH